MKKKQKLSEKMDEGVDVWPPRASRSVLSQPSHTFLERERENGMGVARWVGVWLERDKKYWLIVVEILSWSLETISLFFSLTLFLSLSHTLSLYLKFPSGSDRHTHPSARTHTHTRSLENISFFCAFTLPSIFTKQRTFPLSLSQTHSQHPTHPISLSFSLTFLHLSLTVVG